MYACIFFFLPVTAFIHGQTQTTNAERSKQHTLWPFSLYAVLLWPGNVFPVQLFIIVGSRTWP